MASVAVGENSETFADCEYFCGAQLSRGNSGHKEIARLYAGDMAAELNSDHRVLYLYGITESRPSEIPPLIGVDRLSGIEEIDCDGVFAWISRVPAEDFETNLAHNMENLDWLAETSVAHQRVIAAIGRKTDILPARLGTIFRTDVSLCKHVTKRVDGLKDDFARIRGADEWGVKVFGIESIPARLPKVRTGKDYLKAKAALIPGRKLKVRSQAELAKFGRALERVATETAAAGSVSRGQRGLEYQVSLLVKRSRRKKLESLLEKFARQWAEERRIECTGPWPPYSFVSHADNILGAK